MSKYFILVNDQKTGPFEEADVVAAYQKGIYTKDTRACCDGTYEWKSLKDIPAFNMPAAEAPASAAGEVPPPPAEPEAVAIAEPAADPKPSKPSAFWSKAKCCASTCPAKLWKGMSSKAKVVTASVAGAVVLALAFCVWGGSISSEKDVISYLDKKFARAKAVDKSVWAGYRNSRRSIILSMDNENSSRDGRRALASALARCGSMSGIEYIFEEKAFESDVADSALPGAAGAGHLDIVEYLVEEQCSDKEGPKDQAFMAACACGHVKICRYLVKEGGVKVETSDLARLVEIDMQSYKDSAKNLRAVSSRNWDEADVMDHVADVARFLIENGADPDDSRVQAAAKNCPNSKLLDVLSKKK